MFEGLGYKIDFILDGGVCLVGVEFIVVMVEDEIVSLLCFGGFDCGVIELLIGFLVWIVDSVILVSFGMLKSYYVFGVKVCLNVIEVCNDEILLGFGEIVGDFNLFEIGDLVEVVIGLFVVLR